jgi:hypothetical protein
MGVYSTASFVHVGQTVTVDLWHDNAGAPGALLQEFTDTISAVNTDGASSAPGITQKYADFASPINLAANTVYWISMSGGTVSSGFELGQTTLYPAVYGSTAWFELGNFTYAGLTDVGTDSIRLYGLSTVPEPTTAVSGLCTLGFVFVSFLRRLRHSNPATIHK